MAMPDAVDHVDVMVRNIADGPTRIRQGLLEKRDLDNMITAVGMVFDFYDYKRRRGLKPAVGLWGNEITNRENDAKGYTGRPASCTTRTRTESA